MTGQVGGYLAGGSYRLAKQKKRIERVCNFRYVVVCTAVEEEKEEKHYAEKQRIRNEKK